VIATVDRVRAMLPQLEASIPPTVKVSILSDRTQTIRASVTDVQFTLLLSVGLVVMVIFLFPAQCPGDDHPGRHRSLVADRTFAVLYELGYSLDNLSLMALTIAVASSSTMPWSSSRTCIATSREGLSPIEASLKGAGEIGFTIVSITNLADRGVHPLFLMSGYVGLLFREFAVTISVSLILSLVIALTLTPLMCSRLLKPEHEVQHGLVYRLLEAGFDGPPACV